MRLYENETRTVKNIDCLKFGGLDTRHKISLGSLADCENLSSDAYPCLAPRSGRVQIDLGGISEITNLAAANYKSGELTSFTGAAGGYFYFEGEKIDNAALSDGRKSIAKLGSKIIIFPDKLYFDCQGDAELNPLERGISPEKIVLTTTTDSDTGEYKSLIRANYYFSAFFEVGDSLVISGCPAEDNNTVLPDGGADEADGEKIVSVTVLAIENTTMRVKLLNCFGEEIPFPENGDWTADGISLKTFVPDLAQICVSGGRLWGTSAGGKNIFASKKGDAARFGTLTSAAADVWRGAADDDTPFTGIIDRCGAPAAFKSDALFQIYGDRPSNFSIKKADLWGSADERSIAALGNSLYYLGSHGFCRYSGGGAALIGGGITKKYVSCVGGSDGQKYYACALGEDGERDLLVYDPRYDVWHREDGESFVDFIAHDGVLYGATDNALCKMYGSDYGEWYAVGKRHTEDDFGEKRLGFVYIRAEMPEGGAGYVYADVRVDDGEFEELGCVRGEGFIVKKIPVRLPKCDSFQLRLRGFGNVIVHDVREVLV